MLTTRALLWALAAACIAVCTVGIGGEERPGAIIYLTDGAPARIADLQRSLSSLDRHFNDRFHYPVIIFHGIDTAEELGEAAVAPLTPALQAELQASTRSRLIFSGIRMSSYAPADAVTAAPKKLFDMFTMGYRHMCNFFSGPVAFEPALAGYRYYWRFDTDSQLLGPVHRDPFAAMASHGWRYGWATSQCDWPKVTQGLYAVAEAALGPYAGGAAELASKLAPDMADDSCLRGEAGPTPYNNRVYYNNFEIVDLEFLRSDAYQAWYRAVLAAGGIYTSRWGDAPIRTLAVRALLTDDAIHRFDDISYYHQNIYGPLAGQLIALGVVVGVAAAVFAVLRCVPAASRQRALCMLQSRSLKRGCSAVLTLLFCLRPLRCGCWVKARAVVGSTSPARLRTGSGGASSSAAAVPGGQKYRRRSPARQCAIGAIITTVLLTPLWMYSRSRLDLSAGLSGRDVSSRDQGSAILGSIARPVAWQPGAQSGCWPDQLDCLLAHQADGEKRVVVTAVNAGALPFLWNLLHSWAAVGVNHFLLFPLDAIAAHALIEAKLPAYWDPTPISTLNRPACAYPSCAPPLGLHSGLEFARHRIRARSRAAAAAGVGGGQHTRFGSEAFILLTQRKNDVMLEVVRAGYHAFFTDGDTVWRQNPLAWPGAGASTAPPAAPLAHMCNSLRLGDTINYGGDMPRDIASRADCGGVHYYDYDVKGMYGDSGGMDTGYWYLRNTTAAVRHMTAVAAYQRVGPGDAYPTTPEVEWVGRAVSGRSRWKEGGLHIPDQETFNALLQPWLAREKVIDGQGMAAVANPADNEQPPDSAQGFGVAGLRVAQFAPLAAPTGCRLPRAQAEGAAILVAHANCLEGYTRKVAFLWLRSMWWVRLWDDSLVLSLAAVAAVWLCMRWGLQLQLQAGAGGAAAWLAAAADGRHPVLPLRASGDGSTGSSVAAAVSAGLLLGDDDSDKEV